ncbi:MAG TPA: hypothetical protein VNQ79_22910 [Blastocatellia bacterium]|nr:hypothetical protein [Blastocatellia bacterium]
MNEHQIERLIEGFEGLRAVVLSLDRRLGTLEEKVEARFYDTRPMMEVVVAKLDGIEERIGGIEERMTRLEARMGKLEERMDRLEERMDRLEERIDRLEVSFEQFRDETREQLAHISHQMEILTLDVMEVRAKQRSLDKRVTSLENPPVS